MSRRKPLIFSYTLVLVVIGLLIFALSPAAAQNDTSTPGYIVNIRDQEIVGSQLVVEFEVTNIGGASSLTTRAELVAFDNNEPRVLSSTNLRPLAGNNDIEVMTLATDLNQFPAGSVQFLQVQIASLPGQNSITSSPGSLSVQIPLTLPAEPVVTPEQGSLPQITIPGINFTLDLNNREQLALAGAILATIVIILLLITILLRLIFSRTPDFRSVWQPPYATVPTLDPYSTAGIRQSWQTMAQNNLITSPSVPGTYHAIKLLLGTNGQYLSGWEIVAMRLVQYDQFGRVSRTETLASGKIIRQLNRLADKSGRLPREKLLRQVTPAAKQLAKSFSKKVTVRSAMLPIAVDVRFRGVHGEVNIVFELHRCENGYWQPVDRWQPEMMLTSKTMLESYSYSLFGQAGGETMRQFRKRLPDDLARTLTDMIGAKPPPVPSMIASPAQSTGINEAVNSPE